MVLLTPFCQGTHLLSVGRLIVVGDQAYHRCVVCKFDDDVGAVCSCTVVCVQGVQEWAEDAALRSTSVEDQGILMLPILGMLQNGQHQVLFLNILILIIFGIKDKSIILMHTMCFWLLLHLRLVLWSRVTYIFFLIL